MFRNDGTEAGMIPMMLWKMLEELGYEKKLEHFGTQAPPSVFSTPTNNMVSKKS
jgi:hypothetical protein